MLITHYEPERLFGQFNRELNRLFQGPHARKRQTEDRDWSPAVDIHETAQGYVLTVDLPGVDRKDVEITVDDSILTIKGTRSTAREDATAEYHRRERTHGNFQRQFTLPDNADSSAISATGSNGILEIVIPGQEKLQPRKITVN